MYIFCSFSCPFLMTRPIAISARICKILAAHENLPALLTSIEELRGAGRDEALQRALGLTEINDQTRPEELGEDVLVLRELAEAIGAAVGGENSSALGLNGLRRDDKCS